MPTTTCCQNTEDVQQHEAVVDRDDDQHPARHADQVADAAEQRDATDHHAGDGEQQRLGTVGTAAGTSRDVMMMPEIADRKPLRPSTAIIVRFHEIPADTAAMPRPPMAKIFSPARVRVGAAWEDGRRSP